MTAKHPNNHVFHTCFEASFRTNDTNRWCPGVGNSKPIITHLSELRISCGDSIRLRILWNVWIFRGYLYGLSITILLDVCTAGVSKLVQMELSCRSNTLSSAPLLYVFTSGVWSFKSCTDGTLVYMDLWVTLNNWKQCILDTLVPISLSSQTLNLTMLGVNIPCNFVCKISFNAFRVTHPINWVQHKYGPCRHACCRWFLIGSLSAKTPVRSLGKICIFVTLKSILWIKVSPKVNWFWKQ